MTENDFEKLAEENPEALFELMSQLEPTELTFAAEILGKHSDHFKHLFYLCDLLNHEKVYVREGAIYGLYPHRKSMFVKAAFETKMKSSECPELKEIIADYLRE